MCGDCGHLLQERAIEIGTTKSVKKRIRGIQWIVMNAERWWMAMRLFHQCAKVSDLTYMYVFVVIRVVGISAR